MQFFAATFVLAMFAVALGAPGGTKIPPIEEVQEHPNNTIFQNDNNPVACGGGNGYCPARNTCCMMHGVYKCCRILNAVCCDNFCCPEGYYCAPNQMCNRKHSQTVGSEFWTSD